MASTSKSTNLELEGLIDITYTTRWPSTFNPLWRSNMKGIIDVCGQKKVYLTYIGLCRILKGFVEVVKWILVCISLADYETLPVCFFSFFNYPKQPLVIFSAVFLVFLIVGNRTTWQLHLRRSDLSTIPLEIRIFHRPWFYTQCSIFSCAAPQNPLKLSFWDVKMH